MGILAINDRCSLSRKVLLRNTRRVACATAKGVPDLQAAGRYGERYSIRCETIVAAT